MFEVFGEFNSADEINATAEGLLTEKDFESLKTLCKENGIDEEDAQDYADGILDSLCNTLTAAYGKLQVEVDDLKPYEIMKNWIEYIKSRCLESDEVARAVRRKGKSLKGCMGALLKWSFTNAQSVDKDVVKAAGITAQVKLGIPSMGRAKQIITEYYTK